MNTISPFSVKLSDKTRSTVRRIASLLAIPESRVVSDSLESVLDMVDKPGHEPVPRLVIMIRDAEEYDRNPPLLGTHIKKIHQTGGRP